MHANKALYSFSYTCITAGASGVLFTGIYLMVRLLVLFYPFNFCFYFLPSIDSSFEFCLDRSPIGDIVNFQVDVFGYRRTGIVFEWIGMHALVIYVLIACNILPLILHGFYWGKPQNNIVSTSLPFCVFFFFWEDCHLVLQLFNPLECSRALSFAV